MDSLPRTDVELGSVVSPGFLTNGERDIVTYNQHLRSKWTDPQKKRAIEQLCGGDGDDDGRGAD